MTGARERPELKSLTSLRGLAAMAVIAQHFSATAQQHAAGTIPSLVPHGYVAVDFFFVLSGFVMCYVYLDEFRADGWSAFPSFLGRRLARLMPLNAFVLAAIGLASALSLAIWGENLVLGFSDISPVRDLLANLLMVQGLGIAQNLNGPSWSVSSELLAYVAFPALIALVFGQIPRVAVVIAAATAALMFLALAQPRLGLPYEAPPGSLVRCFAEFTIGMASYRLFSYEPACRLLARDTATFGIAALAMLAMVARCDLAAVAVFPFLVIAFAANAGRAAGFVQLRPFYVLGVISYSLYLLHSAFRGPELALLEWIHPAPLGRAPALLFAAVGSLAVIPFAQLTFAYVERPGRKVMRQLLQHGTALRAWTLWRGAAVGAGRAGTGSGPGGRPSHGDGTPSSPL